MSPDLPLSLAPPPSLLITHTRVALHSRHQVPPNVVSQNSHTHTLPLQASRSSKFAQPSKNLIHSYMLMYTYLEVARNYFIQPLRPGTLVVLNLMIFTTQCTQPTANCSQYSGLANVFNLSTRSIISTPQDCTPGIKEGIPPTLYTHHLHISVFSDIQRDVYAYGGNVVSIEARHKYGL